VLNGSMDYVLPIRTAPDADVGELADYVRRLSGAVNVIVVDSSDADVVAAHGERFAGVTHVPVRPDLRLLNGKVNGVLTGLRMCRSNKVVIADDDVRYTAEQLERIAALLDRADVVRPQNYFDPAPWHARWDTARSLLNRAFGGGDYPGTLAVRLTDRLRRDGYDGDVLFENLELIRTVRAAGGRELVASDLYVRRLPPTARQFLRQRVRQAYDSQAQPLRLLGELMLLPGAALGVRRPRRLAVGCLLAVGLAELGRRRSGGAAYFARSAPLCAPLWLGERALCSWAALGARLLLGGASYSGRRISCPAHSVRTLRARQRQASAATASGPAR
jgi:hypothetical protein